MKLIDKDALVAEIDERIKIWKEYYDEMHDAECHELASGAYLRMCELKDFKKFLDTFEVKEVDLEKESELIANGIMIGVQANRYNTVVYNTKRNDFNHSHLMLAARKGIELGLKAKQG